MNLTGWRLLLFALLGAASIALLASLGVPDQGEREVDRFSGRRVFAGRGVAGALAAARGTGDARLALPRIEAALRQYPNHPALRRTRLLLEAELSARPGTAPSDAEAQSLPEPAALVARLRELEADDEVAEATEEWFAPLARWPEEKNAPGTRPDERAARLVLPATDPGPLLEIARLFQAENRSRSRFRWLVRAFESFPGTPSARDALVTAYVEHGRLREALMVLGAAVSAAPEDVSLLKRRAEIAGWLAFPRVEREMRERILAREDSPEARERLIYLCEATGEPEAAAPHAEKLAEATGERGAYERALFLLLDGGKVDEALAFCGRRIARGDDPEFWRGRIVDLALFDLRVERAIEELRRMEGAKAERRLEGLYRRRDMRPELLQVLRARLAKDPSNAALEEEVLRLLHGLGRAEEVGRLLDARLDRAAKPLDFFEGLPQYRAWGLSGLEGRAMSMARSEGLLAEDLPRAAEAIRPWFAEAPWREVARAMAERFPDDPAARKLLLELVDFLPDDAARAVEAERIGRLHPDDPEIVGFWIERASWAGALESELAARETWVGLRPGDADNRRKLGDLYSAAHNPAAAIEHWRVLAESEGPGSEATLRLVDALFAADRIPEAMTWLERRAELPETSVEDKLHVAETLFGNEQLDRALPFYMAVLEREPDQPRALLRAGQIRSWTNDPRGAIPFLERRLRTRDEEEPVVRFYLGEAYWSVKRDGDAAREHRAALEALSEIESPDRFQRTITAKILTRLGRVEQARPIYVALLAEDPDNVGLLLDYADALASVNLVTEARPLVDRARAIDASGARGMRLDGQLAIREGRHAEAAALLRESLERHGPDAGVEADLGRALELDGRWRLAADAYGRSLELQKDNRDLERTVHDLRDQLADLLLARVEFARAGDDQMLRAEAVASHLFDGDLWRGAASVAFEWLRGPAAAAGGSEVETFLADLSVSALRRFGDADCAGAGLALYPGAEGDLPAGLWAGASLARLEPFREAHVRVHVHELWKDPAAAAGLGGRTSGISLGGQAELGERFWAALDFGYDLLSLSQPEADDGRIELQAVAGYRLVEGRFAHANRLETRTAPYSGLLGPQIEFDPAEGNRTAVSVWLSYFGIRMLGDAELTALLPIGERFDYLTANARADFHLAPGLGGKVEGYAGTELGEGNFLWGLEAGLTWRSRERMELRLSILVGQALGRADAGAIAAAASLGLEWRW